MLPQTGRRPSAAGAPARTSHAVVTVLELGIGQLLRMLDQEAALADEFSGPPRLKPVGVVAPIVGVGDLFLVVFVFVVGSGDAVLQDLVEGGFDVVLLEQVVVVFVFIAITLGRLRLARAGRRLGRVGVDDD